MEMVSRLAGEPFSNHPECACPVITAFVVAMTDDDNCTDDVRQALKPFLPRIVGTRDPSLNARRGVAALDWIIRVQRPIWLEAAGLSEFAYRLRTQQKFTQAFVIQAEAIAAAMDAQDDWYPGASYFPTGDCWDARAARAAFAASDKFGNSGIIDTWNDSHVCGAFGSTSVGREIKKLESKHSDEQLMYFGLDVIGKVAASVRAAEFELLDRMIEMVP